MPSIVPCRASRVKKKWSGVTDTIKLKCCVGIEKIDIDLEKQTVVVDTALPRETVLEAIKKTGKTVKE